MNKQYEPMPLSDLPEYVRASREVGQSDSPVVQMGNIVVNTTGWSRIFAYSAAACLFLVAGGMLTYAVGSPKSITIATAADVETLTDIVEEGGVRVISVKKGDDDTYEVKVLTFRSLGSLLDRLRRNKEFDKVDAAR